MDNQLRIIELYAQGIKKLKAVDIVFTDGVNVLMGGTQQGKTSVLEVINMALQGMKAGGPRDLIAHGGETGEFGLDIALGDKRYRIDRKLKKGKEPEILLKEIVADGKPAKVSSPQAFLKDLIPAIGETPGSFLRKTAAEKLRFILDRHSVNLADLEKKVAAAKSEKDTLTAQQQLFVYAKEAPPEGGQETLAAKEKELAEINAANAEKAEGIEKRAKVFNDAYTNALKEYNAYLEKVKVFDPEEKKVAKEDTGIEFEEGEIARIEEDLRVRKEMLALRKKENEAKKKALADAKVKLSPVKEPDKQALADALQKLDKEKALVIVSVDDLEAEIETLKEADKGAAKYREDHAAYKKKEEELSAANTKIKEARNMVRKALAAIPAKVEGMRVIVDEEGKPDGIYVDGIFCQEWSGAEGFAIAAKILRRYTGQSVLLIDQGESIYYDRDAFRNFCEWARNDGVQVIISVVGEQLDPDENINGFIVEEGEVRAINVETPTELM